MRTTLQRARACSASSPQGYSPVRAASLSSSVRHPGQTRLVEARPGDVVGVVAGQALVRVAAFPNEVEQDRASALATELGEIAGRIEYLEAQLRPVRHHDE